MKKDGLVTTYTSTSVYKSKGRKKFKNTRICFNSKDKLDISKSKWVNSNHN